MKIQFLVKNMSLVFLLSSSLYADSRHDEYQYIQCSIEPIVRKEITTSHPHIPGPTAIDTKASLAQVTSTNWCGYAAATNLTSPAINSVSAVSASWIVPAAKTSPNGYCAIWVGIDGYNSPTVEQIGTSHDVVNGVQQNSAWFEMYPGGSYDINKFPLAVGDVISASVQYMGNGVFMMTLTNDTQKVITTIPTSYTTLKTALRESAEWIIEAPYLNGILPLDDFVTAYMWGCFATINGVTAPINNNAWQNVSMKMVTPTGTTKATPSALLPDNGSFFVTWSHK